MEDSYKRAADGGITFVIGRGTDHDGSSHAWPASAAFWAKSRIVNHECREMHGNRGRQESQVLTRASGYRESSPASEIEIRSTPLAQARVGRCPRLIWEKSGIHDGSTARPGRQVSQD